MAVVDRSGFCRCLHGHHDLGTRQADQDNLQSPGLVT